MGGGIDDGYSDGCGGTRTKKKVVIMGGMGCGGSEARALMSAIAETAMMVPFILHNPRMRSIIPRRKIKPSKPCLLPGCKNTTRHNGGYCSADHCRKHRGR